jgi:hypothetical protein
MVFLFSASDISGSFGILWDAMRIGCRVDIGILTVGFSSNPAGT